MKANRADEPHPEVQEFIRMYESKDLPPQDEMPVVQNRRLTEELSSDEDLLIEVENVEDWFIDGPVIDVPIRIYDPRETQTGASPVLLFFHGGEFITGNIETHDTMCRKLAQETGYPVISVEYRLAPENPFPAGLRDCYTVLEWLSESASELGIDRENIVVTGDSSGANLATGTSLLSRDRGGPEIAYQVLIYPSLGKTEETKSYKENAEGYFLTSDYIDAAYDYYTKSDIDVGNKYAWPREEKDYSDLPPATIITAGFDPLRDDGVLYAEELEEAGIPVAFHNYDDMIHAFMGFISDPIDLDSAHDAYETIAEDLQSEFYDAPSEAT